MKKAVAVSIILLLLSAIFIASLQADTETADQVPAETQAVDQVPADTGTVDQVPAEAQTVDQIQADTETADQVPADTETGDQVPADTQTVDRLPESVETPGRIDGSGTYFEITQSQYLNISLASSAEVKLTLESVPRVVMIAIESAAGDASTQISLGGLLPSTTYYKYEDNLHNLQAFTTDAAGSYVFIQDLTNSHIIFIQDTPSTYFITDDDGGGDCEKESIGTWDAANKICTLIKDLDMTIEIDSDGITLDGAGFRITRKQGGSGIFLSKRKDVTIKNVTIEKFSFGIYLVQSKNNKLTGNTLLDNSDGIYLFDKSDDNVVADNYAAESDSGIYLDGSKSNKLTGNSLSDNYRGIYLYGNSDDNVLAENTVTNNSLGVSFRNANHNVVMDNSVSSNTSYGIYLVGSTSNTLTGNMTDANTDSGIYLFSGSDENALTGNTLSHNGNYGLALFLSNKNIIYDNNFIDNKFQAGILGGADNVFNMDAPAGGNYWNNYDAPEEGCIDDDHDGFCDAPDDFNGILDELPWTIANGWLDSDGDGIPDDEDDCPEAAGPADQNGCPYVDETHVSMRIVDYQRSGVCGYTKRGWMKRSCTVDLQAVNVRIYNLEDEQFSEAYGHWPSRRRLEDIYQADVGLTGLCTTDESGKCLAGAENQGQFFVVAKYVDVDSRKTVYIGKFKDYGHHEYGCWWDWHRNDADADDSTPPTKVAKNLHITKLIQKNGYVSFLGKYMMVACGP
jgi:parallel beta-helix repeat protein